MAHCHIHFVLSETFFMRPIDPLKLNNAIMNLKAYTSFFKSSTVKSFGILPKHNGYGFTVLFLNLFALN